MRLEVKYNLISDLCSFEILVRRFLKAYKGTQYNHHFEASKLRNLPSLNPEDEAEIVKKWKEEEDNKASGKMMNRDVPVGRRPPISMTSTSQVTAAHHGTTTVVGAGTSYMPHSSLNPQQHQQLRPPQQVQRQPTTLRASPMTPIPSALASMDLNHFYNNLPYPKIVPQAEMEETRRRLLPVILEQRSVSPPVHVAFLYNCHLLAVITHGLLSYKKFHEEYRKTFNYSVPPNVTLRKLLSRYPTLFEEINMEDPNDKGIKNKRGEFATQDDIYRCAAIDDWNDAKCPYHLRDFWLHADWIHLLPNVGLGPGLITKTNWGKPAALNIPPLLRPPWIAGGVQTIQNNPPDFINNPQMNYINNQPTTVVATNPPQAIVTDVILNHPVAVALKFIYELIATENNRNRTLSIRHCALLITEKLVPYGGGGLLSMMSEWERDDEESGGSGHISDILQKDSPYDDGGSLLTKKDEDFTLLFRQLPDLFQIVKQEDHENRVEIIPYSTSIDISYVLARSLRSHGFREIVI